MDIKKTKYNEFAIVAELVTMVGLVKTMLATNQY